MSCQEPQLKIYREFTLTALHYTTTLALARDNTIASFVIFATTISMVDE